MTPLENEITALKKEVVSMWILFQSQLNKAKEAMVNFDKDVAREVLIKEKRVNSYELKIDRDCENIFALHCPVAVDLRFLLAALKINSNLERIGDIAEGIAKYVIDAETPFTEELLKVTRILPMYEEAVHMLEDTQDAFEKEDTVLARGGFKKNAFLASANQSWNKVLEAHLAQHPGDTAQALWLLSIIRRLERVGDQAKNVAEEIIFYLE